jgi:hypothetical protein
VKTGRRSLSGRTWGDQFVSSCALGLVKYDRLQKNAFGK